MQYENKGMGEGSGFIIFVLKPNQLRSVFAGVWHCTKFHCKKEKKRKEKKAKKGRKEIRYPTSLFFHNFFFLSNTLWMSHPNTYSGG